MFSFVGYLSQEIAVNNRSQINLSLSTDTKALNEVIVVGYGTQKKRDLTGAISSINPAGTLPKHPRPTSCKMLRVD